MGNGINRLVVQGFMAFREVDVTLGDLNVVIGANASGKSSFLASLRLLQAIGKQALDAFVAASGGPDSLAHHGLKVTPRLRFAFVRDARAGPSLSAVDLAFSPPDRLRLAGFNGGYYPPAKMDAAIRGKGMSEIAPPLVADELTRLFGPIAAGGLHGFRAYHFHDTAPTSPMRLTSDIDDNRELRGDAGNLAAYLYMLKVAHSGNFAAIESTLRQVFPSFAGFILEPSRLNEKTINLRWRETGSEYEFGAHQMSDGTLRFLCLATLLLQPLDRTDSPTTITLDEPELGLHPAALVLLASMLRTASKQVQLIVSTQSSALLSALETADAILVAERKGSESVIKRLDPAELAPWLEDYSLGDVWEKGVIGGRP